MYRLNEGATASCMRADAASEDSAASALTTARKWLQCSRSARSLSVTRPSSSSPASARIREPSAWN